MYGGDHRNGKLAPHQRRRLRQVGDPVRALAEIGERPLRPPRRHCRETLHVEPGREAAPRAVENDGAQFGRTPQPLARLDQRLEHRRIERVQFRRPVERDLRDAVREGERNPLPNRPDLDHRSSPDSARATNAGADDESKGPHDPRPSRRDACASLLRTRSVVAEAIGQGVASHPAARPPRRRGGDAHGRVHGQCDAGRSVQEFQFPPEMGRALRRRRLQGVEPQAFDRGDRASRGRRPFDVAQVAWANKIRGDHARARRHLRPCLRGLGERRLEARRGRSAARFSSPPSARR